MNIMTEKINALVDVISVYRKETGKTIPLRLLWQGRAYTITKLGFHHTVRVGRCLHHLFSVTDGNLFFRLNHDTEMLSWTLEEVSDGLTT